MSNYSPATTPRSRRSSGKDQRSARPVVAHVLDSLGIGGMEAVAVNLIERTSERYRHCAICLREAGENAARLQALGIQVITLEKRPGKDIGAYWRLKRLLRRMGPDIVHTYNIGAIDVAFWARLAGVRRVVHAEHGRDASDPHGHSSRYRWLRRLLAPAIDHFVAVSADLERWLIEDVGIKAQRVQLIRNGIDTGRYCPGSTRLPVWRSEFAPPGSIVIGSVGRLDTVKAFDTLVSAFAQAGQRLPQTPLRLVLVGDGPERQRLAEHARDLGVSDHVWFAGARGDVDQLMRDLDVYVCSSIAEGIALTILEAMASALPVIATRVGGNVELISDNENGRLVASGDASAMAEAICELVEDPQHAESFGRAARARVERSFSIRSMTDAYCLLYDRMLGRTRQDPSETAPVEC